jgi:hypothetical protein
MPKQDHKRKDARFDCLVPIDGKKGSLFDDSLTVDISKGGMGFVSTHEIPVDQKIPIQLDLGENEEPILVVGRVQWNRPIEGTGHYRIGVVFESVIQGSKSRLKKYFAEHDVVFAAK